MNYQKQHNLIIKNGSKDKPSDGRYYERHHILPICLGGGDSDNNLIYLTGREHFVIHWLLHKINKGNKDLERAFKAMGITSRSFEKKRIKKADKLSNLYLDGKINLSNFKATVQSYEALSSVTKSKEYRESVSGLTSPVSKFLFDFYNEKGEIVHEGTYATFAKEFNFKYGPVYQSFKHKGFYKEWSVGNKRSNPHRTEAPLIDMFDAKTGELVLAKFKAHEQKDYLRDNYGIFPAKVSSILNGKQRQSKGYTFRKSV